MTIFVAVLAPPLLELPEYIFAIVDTKGRTWHCYEAKKQALDRNVSEALALIELVFGETNTRVLKILKCERTDLPTELAK